MSLGENSASTLSIDEASSDPPQAGPTSTQMPGMKMPCRPKFMPARNTCMGAADISLTPAAQSSHSSSSQRLVQPSHCPPVHCGHGTYAAVAGYPLTEVVAGGAGHTYGLRHEQS